MTAANRRYDIDWLRVIAIGLLLVYHISIGFQAWGIMLGFIVNGKPWESLWIPMTMLNVWRIPLLFFVSGMGVYFAMQNRNWKQLLKERTKRIFIPFLFGSLVIVPLQIVVVQNYYQRGFDYEPSPAHLWFLGNIFVYVVLLTPIFYYLKKNERGKIVGRIKKWLSSPLGLLIVSAAFVAEVLLVKPALFELYAMTWHGFFLGLIAFFSGFCFVLSGEGFWKMLVRWRWLFLVLAACCYTWRLLQSQMRMPDYLLSIESNCWIFSIFAFGHLYLNKPGKLLRYLSQAAYPVYLLHMLFLFLGSALIFPLEIDVWLKFILVFLFTIAGCFIFYELFVRRIPVIRLLFGLPQEFQRTRFSFRRSDSLQETTTKNFQTQNEIILPDKLTVNR